MPYHLSCALQRSKPRPTCRYLRVASSFMMCAAFIVWPIFSLALRSWIPMLVTPMGHGAVPAAQQPFHSESSLWLFQTHSAPLSHHSQGPVLCYQSA